MDFWPNFGLLAMNTKPNCIGSQLIFSFVFNFQMAITSLEMIQIEHMRCFLTSKVMSLPRFETPIRHFLGSIVPRQHRLLNLVSLCSNLQFRYSLAF